MSAASGIGMTSVGTVVSFTPQAKPAKTPARASERMGESVLQPLPVRLARRLCALATDFGSEVHISQEQLGVFVGAARESVNRQLQLWRKDGILDLQRGRILLQNMTKLTAVARND